MQKNYYQILRVKSDATSEEIEQAFFRAKARLKQSGIEDPDTLALLQDAYDALADEGDRAAYDQSLTEPPPPPIRLTGQPRAAADNPRPGVPPLPPEFLAMEARQEDDKPERRRWLLPLFAGVFVVLVCVVGLMLVRSGPVPVPPKSAKGAEQTNTIAVSSDPIGEKAPAAASGSPAASSSPRTAENVYADVSMSIVRVVVMDDTYSTLGSGSGVVVGRGTVITNCHVATKGPIIEVRSGKDSFPATISIADETYDLCRLEVGGGFVAPPVELGSMKYVRNGQKVYAIGAPAGLELSISEGLVSALRETRLGNIIQTTAPISPGSSGGGLFNINGQLIGITTFQVRGGQNLNFAVPSDWIETMTGRPGPGPSLD